MDTAAGSSVNGGGDVLVVEDDRDMAEALLRLLKVSGYAARHSEHGLAALRAVAERRPAVILLDMLMPVMDGWEFASELRARYGDAIPIVVVSAAEHLQDRCSEMGVEAFLSKPFQLTRLLELVGRYAGAPHA